MTGLSISGALNRGLLLLSHEVAGRVTRSPYEVYVELDLGAGGYAVRALDRHAAWGSSGHRAEAQAPLVILVDTGPLVALFDPRDRRHARRRRVLRTIREPLATTVPVLTEVFHMLSPASQGSDRVRDFIAADGLHVWFTVADHLVRAVELISSTRITPWTWPMPLCLSRPRR